MNKERDSVILCAIDWDVEKQEKVIQDFLGSF